MRVKKDRPFAAAQYDFGFLNRGEFKVAKPSGGVVLVPVDEVDAFDSKAWVSDLLSRPKSIREVDAQ